MRLALGKFSLFLISFVDFGCGFEFACNYDPCVLDDFELCEFLNVSVETTPDDEMGSGTASATVVGGTEPYAYAWFAGETENSFADGISVDSLIAGDYSVIASDSSGCIGTTDFVIDYVNGIGKQDITWNVFPNPTHDFLYVHTGDARQGKLTLINLDGRVADL